MTRPGTRSSTRAALFFTDSEDTSKITRRANTRGAAWRAEHQSAPRMPPTSLLKPPAPGTPHSLPPQRCRCLPAPTPRSQPTDRQPRARVPRSPPMSGGVGPTAGGGITLPSMGQPPPPLHPTPTSPTARPHHHYYLFSIKQLNTLGAAAVLAFSTTVPLSEIAFAVLLLPYLLILAKLAFPQRPGKPDPAAPVFVGPARQLLAAHTVAGFLVGAALPALYILDGLRTADTTGVAAASPHAFLLSAQVFTEGITAAWPWRFSLPVRAAVPVMYSARRMFAAGEWLRQEMEEKRGGPDVAPRRVVAGRVLALANMAFWGANLFAFLVPFYLPRALHRYYCDDGVDRTQADAGDGVHRTQADGDQDKKDS